MLITISFNLLKDAYLPKGKPCQDTTRYVWVAWDRREREWGEREWEKLRF